MKPLVIILFLTFAILCQSQESTELKPPFKNQGEQEDYWAQELFKKEYKKTTYKVYTEKIERIDISKFTYDNKSFNVSVANKAIELIFTKGVLYPQLISGYTTEPRKSDKELDSLSNTERYFYELKRGDNLTITDLEELTFLSGSPKVKRFRFWLSGPKSANPQVYLFELTNEKATEKTTLKKFIKNSKLTFLKAGWIVI
jgi:hypothetical protein